MGSDDLQSLSRQAAQGDPAAQAALCQEYENEVRIVARVHLGTQLRPYLDSLDVTQSVHRSLLNGLVAGKFMIDNSRGLIALACLMARRKIGKQWRKHRRQIRLDSTTDTSTQQLIENMGVQPMDSIDLDDLSPSELARQQLSLMRAAVTPIERLLIDRKLAGKTSAQIAEELKLDPVAVRVRWSRLSAKLRKLSPQE